MLIPKGDGNYFRGIRLVEVLWKATTGIIKRRLTSDIHNHETLHGFWRGGGTVTSNLEAKVLQYLTAMRETVLHTILLDS